MSDGPFDRDIHGQPWRPCAACPHPTPGLCPSRGHTALCRRLEERPAFWRGRIAAMPPEAREPAHTAPRGSPRPEGRPAPPATPRPAQGPPRARKAVGAYVAALSCDYREPIDPQDADGCGCQGRGLAWCLRGLSDRLDGRVSLSACVACVSSSPPPPRRR